MTGPRSASLSALLFALVWAWPGGPGSLLPAAAQEEAPALSEAARSCFAAAEAMRAGTGAADPVVEVCSQAITEQPGSPALLAALFHARGLAYRRQGAYPLALADFDDSLRLNPASVGTANMRAWTFQAMGDFRAAEQAYSVVLQDQSLKSRVAEDSAIWQAFLSRCVVRQRLGEFALALDDCEVALAGWRNGDSLYFAAVAYSELGNCSQAILLLEEALLEADARPRVFGELSLAHTCAGEKQRALSVLDEGLARFPGNPDLVAQRQRLLNP